MNQRRIRDYNYTLKIYRQLNLKSNKMNCGSGAIIAIIVILVIIIAIALCGCTFGDKDCSRTLVYTAGQTAYITDTALAWNQHVALTRMYIIESVNGPPAAAAATLDVLLQNQKTLGDLLSVSYGTAAGVKYTQLLTVHIQQAGEIVANAIAGKDNKVAVANWYENGRQVVAFLTGLNPNLDAKVVQDHWNNHLRLTIDEATNYIQKKYPESLANYQELIQHARVMSNYITLASINSKLVW